MQAESCQYAGFIATEDTDNTAFLMKTVKLFGAIGRCMGPRRHWLVHLVISKWEVMLVSSNDNMVIGQIQGQIKQDTCLVSPLVFCLIFK